MKKLELGQYVFLIMSAEEVGKTLASTWINTGKKEKEFREKICKRFKAPYATATTSGTNALKIALKSLGIGPGDEVVSTPILLWLPIQQF